MDFKQLMQKQEKDKTEITALKDEELFNSSFTYKFNQLSELNSNFIQEIFGDVKQSAIKEWKDKLSARLTEIDKLLNKYKTKVQDKEQSDVFKTGNRQLEQNKQYKDLNERLMIENKKLNEITSLQKKIEDLKAQKETLFEQIIKNHISFGEKIDELIGSFSLLHDDIEIKIPKSIPPG